MTRGRRSKSAFCMMLFHEFMDIVNGIVAKVQQSQYGELVDDLLLGSFLDPFCDKVWISGHCTFIAIGCECFNSVEYSDGY